MRRHHHGRDPARRDRCRARRMRRPPGPAALDAGRAGRPRHLAKLAPFMFLNWPMSGPGRATRLCRRRRTICSATEIDRCAATRHSRHRSDVLAMLVRHREDDGTAMTASEIRDQLVTLLLAGHETTATGLSWTFERLVRHPAVLARAVTAADEKDDALSRRGGHRSLRIRPVVPDITRKLMTDVTIGQGDRQLRLPAAPSSTRPSICCCARPSTTRTHWSSVPNASSGNAPTPTCGSRSAEAAGAASVRRSP